MQIPEGYRPTERQSPFWELTGPFYEKVAEDGSRYIGVRVEAKHGNMRGIAHGGLIATLADIALGYNISCALGWEVPIATVNLTTDYAGAARVGDWLEARVDIQHIGRSIMFANAYIYVGERRIARASGVFSRIKGEPRR